MIGLIAIAVILIVAYVVYLSLVDISKRPEGSEQAWESAIADENSQIGRILLHAARPLAKIPSFYQPESSPRYKRLQKSLLAGNTFSGSVEVYLATEAMAWFIGAVILVGAFFGFGTNQLLFDIIAILLAVGIALYPYNIRDKREKAREKAVNETLPDFAELLLMPLSAGMSPLTAMSFAADRMTGPVAEEVRNLRSIIDARVMDEAVAFRLAGARLGGVDAAAFFNALMQAHLEGGKLVETLTAQASALRKAAHQRARAENRKLPVRLVVIMAAFLLPLLFVLAFIPVVINIGHIAS
jgi:Flp pilus assembly protein TadB